MRFLISYGMTCWMVLCLVASNTLAADKPIHVVVYKEPGKFGGWPANHGIWIWGEEIVLGHRQATFKIVKSGHAVDRMAPQFDVQAQPGWGTNVENGNAGGTGTGTGRRSHGARPG